MGGLVFGGAYTWRGLFSEFYYNLTLKLKRKITFLSEIVPFTTISLARSVRNVFIRERDNETDWDDDDGVDDSDKIVVISGDE